MIEQLGGTKLLEFEHFEFVAAEVPESRLDDLLGASGIAHVEDDEETGIPDDWSPDLLEFLLPPDRSDCSTHPTSRHRGASSESGLTRSRRMARALISAFSIRGFRPITVASRSLAGAISRPTDWLATTRTDTATVPTSPVSRAHSRTISAWSEPLRRRLSTR